MESIRGFLLLPVSLSTAGTLGQSWGSMGSTSRLHGLPQAGSSSPGSASSSRCPAQAQTVYPLPEIGKRASCGTSMPHMARAMSRASIGFSAMTSFMRYLSSLSGSPCPSCPSSALLAAVMSRRSEARSYSCPISSPAAWRSMNESSATMAAFSDAWCSGTS